jgi:hypothetical protein
MSTNKVIYFNDGMHEMFNNPDTVQSQSSVQEPSFPLLATQSSVPEPSSHLLTQSSVPAPSFPLLATQSSVPEPSPPQLVTASVSQHSVPQVALHQTTLQNGGKKQNKDEVENEVEVINEVINEVESELEEEEIDKNPLSDQIKKNNETDDEDIRSQSSDSSLCTERLLSVDPMYIRLTKFLYTPDKKRNITEVLEGIEKKLELLITLFAK